VCLSPHFQSLSHSLKLVVSLFAYYYAILRQVVKFDNIYARVRTPSHVWKSYSNLQHTSLLNLIAHRLFHWNVIFAELIWHLKFLKFKFNFSLISKVSSLLNVPILSPFTKRLIIKFYCLYWTNIVLLSFCRTIDWLLINGIDQIGDENTKFDEICQPLYKMRISISSQSQLPLSLILSDETVTPLVLLLHLQW